jgi:CubicO group peptidase (beta-lactamase class C family)
MTDLAMRVAALGPTIEKLMSIGGTAGLSLGLLHHGKPIHQANYGFRDVEASLPVTEETIFPGCSLTKALTAAALALLVEEKKMTWDTLVKDVLPEFKIKDEILRNCATIADLLCHRTGMSRGDNLYIGTSNNVLIPGRESLTYLNSQERLLPFRGQFQYNKLPYELVGHVIEKLTGSPWSALLRSRIIEPLDMERTYFQTPPSSIDNVARCYNTLDDGTPVPITCVKTGDDSFGGPSAGICTCVKDLLKLYSVFLASANDQFARGVT